MSPDTDDEWLEPWNTMGVWEYQVYPLTVGELRESLRDLPDSLPVQVGFYDGAELRNLSPMHIDIMANDDTPSAMVITVA